MSFGDSTLTFCGYLSACLAQLPAFRKATMIQVLAVSDYATLRGRDCLYFRGLLVAQPIVVDYQKVQRSCASCDCNGWLPVLMYRVDAETGAIVGSSPASIYNSNGCKNRGPIVPPPGPPRVNKKMAKRAKYRRAGRVLR